MAHHSRVLTVVVDVPSPAREREVAFWRGASGADLQPFERFPEYHGAAVPASSLWLLVQDVGASPARMHVDLHTDDVQAEVTRLEALGATREPSIESRPWVVMRDPAGLVFCVVPDPPGSLDESNATRWD